MRHCDWNDHVWNLFMSFLEQDHEDDGEDIKSPEHATDGI